jgi:hypothetical protein
MRRSIWPVLVLLALAPLVAEYLLGNLTFRQLGLFPVLLPMYGGGAVLVREAARRTGRGWPTILMLGLAYGIAEEGLATQSLFNPRYVGLRLLDYGFIPSLGIAGPWTVYVLAIHAFWSVAVPIALVEALFGADRGAPWLGRAGLAVIGVLYVLGVAIVTMGTRYKEHFTATAAQLAASVLAIAAVAAAAFLLFRPAAGGGVPAAPAKGGPRPWALGLTVFLCGSAFHLASWMHWVLPAAATVAVDFALIGIPLAVLAGARRSPGWTPACADAAGIGAVLVYGWWGFNLTVAEHGRASIPGQCFPLAVVLALLAVLLLRGRARGNA